MYFYFLNKFLNFVVDIIISVNCIERIKRELNAILWIEIRKNIIISSKKRIIFNPLFKS